MTSLEPPASAITASYTISIVELLIIHPTVLFIAGLNFVLLFNTKVLHPNLRFILLVQSSSVIVFEFYRLDLIAEQFIYKYIYFVGSFFSQRFAVFIVVFRNSLGHVLLLERLMATFFYRKYETYRKLYFSIGWFTILLIYSGVNFFSTSKSMDFNLLNVILSLFLVALSLLEYLGILIMGCYNKRKYNRFLPEGQNYSLSEKYQLAENIRTSRQLGVAFLCHMLNSMVLCIGGGLVYMELIEGYQIAVMMQTTCIFSSVMDLAIEITVITHHPILKKRFHRLLRRILLCKSECRVDDSGNFDDAARNCQRSDSPPKNINGEILIRKDHPDSHFNMLTQAWR